MKKFKLIIVLTLVLVLAFSTTVFANSNWEKEPNNHPDNANYMITNDIGINYGYISSFTDVDYWYFYTTSYQPFDIILESPQYTDYNLVVYERDQLTGRYSFVGESTNPAGHLDHIRVPGHLPNGVARQYFVLVVGNLSYHLTEPYELVLFRY